MNLEIPLDENENPSVLFGPEDRNLRTLRDAFAVRLSARHHSLHLSGAAEAVKAALVALDAMRQIVRSEGRLTQAQVAALSGQAKSLGTASLPRTAGGAVPPKSAGQREYQQTIRGHDVTVCLGPAGTGKTFLAVAAALDAMAAGTCQRIVLARPAVEAGEKLGYLPGDLQEKVNPYLRPLIDSLEKLVDAAEVRRLMTRGAIEIVPLAFMRGRTLDHSFAILDEAQNCTTRQMLMFLTRLGSDSKAVVTGDPTQTDLPEGEISGLAHAWEVLKGIPGIGFAELRQGDVVRHPLVRRIVEAYELAEKRR